MLLPTNDVFSDMNTFVSDAQETQRHALRRLSPCGQVPQVLCHERMRSAAVRVRLQDPRPTFVVGAELPAPAYTILV